jgi:N-acetylmuramoyl-L-alanine amidase
MPYHARRSILACLGLIGALAPGAAAAQEPHAPACKPGFKIALDVGHTPEAPGATSARGVTEHEYNLKLARTVARTLDEGGFNRTSLIIVHGVGRAQLIARSERANALGADLLLSLHHDDVQDFYHAKWTWQGAAHLYSDRFSGYSLFVSRDNAHFDDSLAFARLLGTALTARGMHYSAHHAEPIRGEGHPLIDPDVGVYLYDELLVLKLSKAPAALLEAGIIVNRAEELAVTSPEGRDRIAAAVLEAVNRFCGGPER